MSTWVADFLWISDGEFLHYWVAISLTLIVLDFFLDTEILSWIALGVFAAWATAFVDPSPAWATLVFINFYVLAGLFYIFVFKTITNFIVNFATRNAPPELNDTLKGKTGVIGGEEFNMGVSIDGVIYPVAEECREKLTAGDIVKITDFKNGIAYVAK